MAEVTDPCDLDRFVSAQEPVFDPALRELRSRRKRSHWMWFVFPQLRALGRSSMTDYYGISSLAEARAYLANRCRGRGSISAQGQCLRSRRHRSTSAGRANIRSGRTEHLDTAPQFCGLKHDHERLSRQVPLQTNCAAFLTPLAADFVECVNRTAEIRAAADAVS